MTRLPLWLLCVAAPLLTGCDSADAASAKASATASARPFDAVAYCHSVCERATACGIDALEQTVKANAADVGVLNKARASAAETTATCEKTCARPDGESASAAPTDEQREALVDAERCLEQTTCEAFATCLGTVAKR